MSTAWKVFFVFSISRKRLSALFRPEQTSSTIRGNCCGRLAGEAAEIQAATERSSLERQWKVQGFHPEEHVIKTIISNNGDSGEWFSPPFGPIYLLSSSVCLYLERISRQPFVSHQTWHVYYQCPRKVKFQVWSNLDTGYAVAVAGGGADRDENVFFYILR